MASSGKQKKHQEKMKRKRAIKAQRRSAYAAMAGTSKKKKRQNIKSGATVGKKAHLMANCGNTGCKKCYPLLNPGSLNGKTHKHVLEKETTRT